MAVVAGLATFALATATAGARPLFWAVRHVFAVSPPTTQQCIAATGLACYDANQFETAYDMKSLYGEGLTGAGKTIVIVDSFGSPTIRHDLAEYDRQNGLPAPPSFEIIQPVGPVPRFDPGKDSMGSWAIETSLDVEMAHTMAPGANILLVETPVAETEGITGFPQIIDAENYVLRNHLGDVITQSFGATEETFPSVASLMGFRSAYIRAAADNVTVLASAGDTGATNYELNGVSLYRREVIGWPSSDPLVTSVGGTQLHLDQDGSRLAPDNVWDDTELLHAVAAGSGGPSHVFSRPSYQDSVRNVVGDARGTPDVSLSAAVNGGALVYMSFKAPLIGITAPGYYIIGGTSEASPLFSGLVAIADQAAGHDLGLLNPALYALGDGAGSGLVDITLGNNAVSFVQGGILTKIAGFAAGPGYDMASGLGTVDGAKLVAQLAG